MSTDVAKPKQTDVVYVPFMGRDELRLNVGVVRKFFASPTRSGHLPDDVDCMKFMALCKARGLNPFEGDAFIQGYELRDGTPRFSLITAHQAFLKRAEVHEEFDGMESGVTVAGVLDGEMVERQGDFVFEHEQLLGGWARVHFKTRKHPMFKRLKLATFNTGKSRWEKDPAGMIVKCAEADALRSSFPSMLGGMYLADEMESVHEHQQQPKKRIAASDLTTFATAEFVPAEVGSVETVTMVPDAEQVGEDEGVPVYSANEPPRKGQLFDTHSNTGE